MKFLKNIIKISSEVTNLPYSLKFYKNVIKISSKVTISKQRFPKLSQLHKKIFQIFIIISKNLLQNVSKVRQLCLQQDRKKYLRFQNYIKGNTDSILHITKPVEHKNHMLQMVCEFVLSHVYTGRMCLAKHKRTCAFAKCRLCSKHEQTCSVMFVRHSLMFAG